MERPASPELDAVMSAAEELRDLEARVATEFAEAKRQLASTVDALAGIDDPSALLKAAVYAYWYAPEVSANQLALLTVGKPSAASMLKRSAAVSIGISCSRCGKDLPITSRSMMRDVLAVDTDKKPRWASGYRCVCRPCQQEEEKQRNEAYRLHVERRRERQQILARMTYAEYLTTPEWKDCRAGVMNWMLEERGQLACEVCPEREGLSFVHSQFDLANEQEVVSLFCGTCSDALHKAGKLVHPPLPANRAPRIELDLREREFRAKHHRDPDEDR